MNPSLIWVKMCTTQNSRPWKSKEAWKHEKCALCFVTTGPGFKSWWGKIFLHPFSDFSLIWTYFKAYIWGPFGTRVVLNVISSILFACFPTVEHVSLRRHKLLKLGFCVLLIWLHLCAIACLYLIFIWIPIHNCM